MMYFAADGSYGDAEELLIVSTSDWSATDFDLIEDATDSGRLATAIQVCVERETSHAQVKGANIKWFPLAQ